MKIIRLIDVLLLIACAFVAGVGYGQRMALRTMDTRFEKVSEEVRSNCDAAFTEASRAKATCENFINANGRK